MCVGNRHAAREDQRRGGAENCRCLSFSRGERREIICSCARLELPEANQAAIHPRAHTKKEAGQLAQPQPKNREAARRDLISSARRGEIKLLAEKLTLSSTSCYLIITRAKPLSLVLRERVINHAHASKTSIRAQAASAPHQLLHRPHAHASINERWH